MAIVSDNAAELSAFDQSSGHFLWQSGMGNRALRGPVIAPNDTTLALVEGSECAVQLVGFDPDGGRLFVVDVASRPITPTASRLAVAADGTILVLIVVEPAVPAARTSVTLVAYDASGNLRWTRAWSYYAFYFPSDPTLRYGLFVDPVGTVVATAGSIIAFDASTGDKLWQIDGPHPGYCVEPAVLGVGASVLAMQCDGSLFLARDP